jgi:hypothetical protein
MRLPSLRRVTETSPDTMHVVAENSGIATDLLGVYVRSASEAVAVRPTWCDRAQGGQTMGSRAVADRR